MDLDKAIKDVMRLNEELVSLQSVQTSKGSPGVGLDENEWEEIVKGLEGDLEKEQKDKLGLNTKIRELQAEVARLERDRDEIDAIRR